ncbi:MAG: CCA tRNA nucleotidyltransferase [Acholeplasmataceae bacterium]|nr:CCA tRNA nucleotidyltransferase [Acholeplasmataceae bacterium]
MSTIRGARFVIKDFKKAGYEAFIVGGAVRDHLLHMPISDIDITTNAKPHQVQKLFKKTIPTGLKYGTVTVFIGEDAYEVTTYRVDGPYVDGRHPEDVSFEATAEDDVKRRDFTMNGLLMDETGQIIDYVGGKADIKARLIRAIGDPVTRFEEDQLRMLRAFHFVSKLGFDIERKTIDAIKETAKNIENVAMERIMDEMIKILKGDHLKKALYNLVKTGMYKHLPGLDKGIKYVLTMSEMPFVDAFFTISFALHGDVPDAWPFSNRHRHRYKVAAMLANTVDVFDPKTLYTYGVDLCLLANKTAFLLGKSTNMKRQIEEDFDRLPIKSELDLAIRPMQLVKILEKKQGAWLSALLKDMVLAVLDGELQNNYDALIRYAKTHEQPKESGHGTHSQ